MFQDIPKVGNPTNGGGAAPEVFTATIVKGAGSTGMTFTGCTFEPKYIRLIFDYSGSYPDIWDNLNSDMTLDASYVGQYVEGSSSYRSTRSYSNGTITIGAYYYSGGTVNVKIVASSKLSEAV